MQAYYVHDEKKDTDLMVIPETDCMAPVNRSLMEDFISVKPDFSQWQGQALRGIAPDALGRVVATRTEDGDVCIMDIPLWQEKMAAYLGGS